MQASPDNISKIIFIITCIFILAGAFLLLYVGLYNKRKKRHLEEKTNLRHEFEKQLFQSQIEVQERTYASLGKELHDNVGQLLSTAKILLGITEMKLDVVPDTLITANQTISKAIQEIRSLAKILSIEWLQQFSFNENLVSEVERINSAQLIDVSLYNEVDYLPLNSEEQVILFRIVQETLQNALKHSLATTIVITITFKTKVLFLSIEDNGKGFEKSIPTSSGMGLLHMKQRAQILGGSIQWNPNPTGGTIVEINLPVINQSYENQHWNN